MLVTYPYRNYLSTQPVSSIRRAEKVRRASPRCRWAMVAPHRRCGGHRRELPRCRRAAAGPAGKSRMQFINTSDTTLQTDTDQHNAGGELHATLRNNEQHTSAPGRTRREAAAGPAGPGRASRRHAERSSRRGRRAGGTPPTGTHSGPAQHGRPRGGRRSVMATSNAGHQAGQRTTRSRPVPQGPGGSRFRPLGGSQRRVQRIWVPSEPRRWQASTTRAAMPASADLPHVRGSYCFFTPTSPSILRTPS